MTSPLVAWADLLWTGATVMDHTSIIGVGLGAGLGLEEVADRVGFLPNFANVIAVDGGDELALIDTGSFLTAPRVFAEVRRWRKTRLATAVYTHGHVDHAMGVGPFDDEAKAAGRPRPQVVAHEAVPARFDRYQLTAGWNTAINRRQFRVPACAGRPSTAIPTRPTATASTSGSATSPSSCTTARARPTTTPGPGCRPSGCCAPAICSSGRCPTAATRRRSSAT